MVNPEIKNILSRTIKAISSNNDDDFEIEISDCLINNFFTWDENLINGKKILLPNLKSKSAKKEIKEYRPAADMALLYLLFCNNEIIKQNSYSEELKQKFLINFEKTRLLLNVSKQYLGIAKNIYSKINDDIVSCQNDFDLIPLLPLKDHFNIESCHFLFSKLQVIESKLGLALAAKISKLANYSSDQERYLKASKKIIDLLLPEKIANHQQLNTNNQNDGLKSDNESSNFNQENLAEGSLKKKELKSGKEKTISPQIEIKEIKISDEIGHQISKDQDFNYQEKIEFIDGYKVFTNRFDEIIFPAKLFAKDELELLRLQLNTKLENLNTISKKLVLKLKRKLLAKKSLPLEYSQSHGILNRKKLTSIILKPYATDIWQNYKVHDYKDAIVTILIDNSGSMRGLPIVMSALASEIIAATLEKFAIKSEILGFTTSNWRGGESKKLWENLNRPKNPGRLNDLRHIVYKSANQNFKKSKTNLGLMLKDGFLKENIDSEALLWAKSRLMQYQQSRKILIVISDGAPIDDATTANNDNDKILTDHLLKVISKIEKQSKIELVGIGIGHDVTEFYRNSIVIKNLDELGDVMIEKISDLL